ncbi:MAG: hypothetical protein AMXMBFR23_07600 [Chloroflexota bacterium]
MKQPPGNGPVYRGRPPGQRPSGRRRRGGDPLSTAGERRTRRQLNRLVLVVAALILIVTGFTRLASRGSEDAPPPTSTAPLAAAAATATIAPASPATPTPHPLVPVPGAITVEVDRIIDGDTLDVVSAETVIRVRLFGVDTPERGEPCFREATERLRVLAGEVVQLVPDARLTDRYGRELRYVYTWDGMLIDEALVLEGFGVAWTQDGALREQIMASEAIARAAGVGCLWSAN